MNLEYQLFENIEDGIIVISIDGIIEDINSSALNIFGYNYEEVIGQSLALFMFEKDAKFHGLYIQRYISSGIKNVLRKGKELDGRDKNNNKIPLYISVIKYINNKKEIKFIGFLRELKNQILSELNDFKSIFLVSKNYRIACNLDGKIVNTNELSTFLGYDITDTISDSLFNYVHLEDKDKLNEIFHKIQSSSEINNEIIRLLRKDQSEIYFSWNSNIIRTSYRKDEDYYYYHLTIANEITDVIKKDEKINLFENTMNENPSGILITDSDGSIDYANEYFLKCTNLSKIEVLNKNLFKDTFFIQRELKNEIYNIIKKNEIWHGEASLSLDSNKTYFVTIKGIKNKNNRTINYIEVIEDISTVKAIYNQIDVEKNKLKQILEIIPEGILLFNAKGEILQSNSSINNYYQSIYKNDLKSILSEKSLFNTNENNIFIDEIIKLFNSKETATFIEPSPGNYLKILKIENESNLIFVFYDITNETKIEQFRNQIISMVSHELRTPISSITQSLYNFIKYEDKLKDYEKKKTIQIAYDNSQLLGEIVDDLLIISQLDNNKLTLSLSNVNVTNAISEIIAQFDTRLKNQDLELKFIPIDDCIIKGDLKRISQVFRIIIDNSIKYSPKKSQIDITVEKEINKKNGVLVEIKDHGIGISNDDLPFLFNRFFRAKNASNFKGTGLGLSIAKELIELHHGDIQVVSKINEGTVFQIFFPFDVFSGNESNLLK